MILFINKKQIKGHYYIEIYYNGVVTLVQCSENFYNNCKYNVGQTLNENLFTVSYYKKGYDIILLIKLNERS